MQSDVELAVFNSELGWFGILHRANRLTKIKFGFETRKSALKHFADSEIEFETESNPLPDWCQEFIEYAVGKRVSFAGLKLDTEHLTEFQQLVSDQCRKISYGTTLTYGQLAANCKSPKAARAVGGVMKSNRFPIVVPCHRVVRATGLGGFSASQGVTTKQKMLVMEGALKVSPQLTLPGIEQVGGS